MIIMVQLTHSEEQTSKGLKKWIKRFEEEILIW